MTRKQHDHDKEGMPAMRWLYPGSIAVGALLVVWFVFGVGVSIWNIAHWSRAVGDTGNQSDAAGGSVNSTVAALERLAISRQIEVVAPTPGETSQGREKDGYGDAEYAVDARGDASEQGPISYQVKSDVPPLIEREPGVVYEQDSSSEPEAPQDRAVYTYPVSPGAPNGVSPLPFPGAPVVQLERTSIRGQPVSSRLPFPE